jgi:hypothetical protein
VIEAMSRGEKIRFLRALDKRIAKTDKDIRTFTETDHEEVMLEYLLGIKSQAIKLLGMDPDIREDVLMTSIEFVKRYFAPHIKQGTPLKILDIGTDSDAAFTFRLKRFLDERNIPAEIHGVDIVAISEDLEAEARKQGIILKGNCEVEKLIKQESEHGKYNLVFINAPSCPLDLETLDFLLADDGYVIIRFWLLESKRNIRDFIRRLGLREGKLWAIRSYMGMRDLPEGTYHLHPPLVVRRAISSGISQTLKAFLKKYKIDPAKTIEGGSFRVGSMLVGETGVFNNYINTIEQTGFPYKIIRMRDGEVVFEEGTDVDPLLTLRIIDDLDTFSQLFKASSGIVKGRLLDPGKLILDGTTGLQAASWRAKIVPLRTAVQVRKFLGQTAGAIYWEGPLRGLDFGSSQDLQDLKELLTKFGVTKLTDIPATTIFASKFRAKFKIEA